MILTAGTTSVSLDVQIVDDSGLAVTGLPSSTFPAVSYTKGDGAAPTSLTLSDLSLIGSAYSAGGIKEKSLGWYRFDIPDAMLATDGLRPRLLAEASGKHLLHEA